MKLNVIVTGATGMVGEGVLHICLDHPDVESILVLGRRSCGVSHPKLKELVVNDLYDLSSVKEQLKGYNACFFCLGTTSVGKSEEEYRKITYDLTMNTARTLAPINPAMTLCYVSGLGTDGTEKGKIMWARVKGKTENDLAALPFKAVFNFRPGGIRPIKGMKNTLMLVKMLNPLFPLLQILFPKSVVSLEDIGRSMINVSLNGYSKTVLECEDITASARQ